MSKAREIAELGDALTVDGSGNIDVTGTVTATSLAGDGTSITGSPTFGTVTATSYAGDGSALTGIAGGATEFISTAIMNNTSTVVFTNLSDAVYDHYIITLSGVRPSVDNRAVIAVGSADNGSTYTSNTAFLSSNCGNQNDLEQGISGHYCLFGMGQTTYGNSLVGSYQYYNTSSINTTGVGGNTMQAGGSNMNVNAIKLYSSSGIMERGQITLYGVKKS